jgi:hypothetical protein
VELESHTVNKCKEIIGIHQPLTENPLAFMVDLPIIGNLPITAKGFPLVVKGFPGRG